MSRPFISAKWCASVEMIWQVNGQICENVFHVQKGSSYTLTDLQAVRDLANSWDLNHMAALRANGSTLERIRTRQIDIADGATEDYHLTSPRFGTQGAVPMPNNVTFCYKLATGHSGRSRRGRWYLVAIPINFYGATTDQMNASIVPLYTAALGFLKSELATGGHTLVVVSYRSNKAWRSEALVTDVTSFVATDNYFDSQRRRLSGRGT